METQTYRFTWRGIDIEAIYTPHQRHAVDHLEVRSIWPERAPLPITDTGYHASFHEAGSIEASGVGIVEQIVACLDAEARRPHWLKAQQLSLF